MRLLDVYVGVFVARALLFFAFTGALQTFSLHETTRGSNYVPPRWAVILGQIHKKADLRRSRPKTRPVRDQNGQLQRSRLGRTEPGPGACPATQLTELARHPLPLKIFFLLVSMGLFHATLTGIYMSYGYVRNPTTITALLLAGAIIPVIFRPFEDVSTLASPGCPCDTIIGSGHRPPTSPHTALYRFRTLDRCPQTLLPRPLEDLLLDLRHHHRLRPVQHPLPSSRGLHPRPPTPPLRHHLSRDLAALVTRLAGILCRPDRAHCSPRTCRRGPQASLHA